MVSCKNCGTEVTPNVLFCPKCKEKIVLSSSEIIAVRDKISEAKREKSFELAHLYIEALANHGYIPAQREWGNMLERGECGEIDLDGAMKYFYLAALKNDPYSVYRYSRLIGRENESASHFWLEFSAVLGCAEAYYDMAKHLDDIGLSDVATYYYTLAAKTDNVNAIITLAKRYYDGVSAPKNDSYAKWYMDKLPIPPISAIKLAYKLRSTVAQEPDDNIFIGYFAFVKSLAEKAAKMGFSTAQRRLTEILAGAADSHALAQLGVIYAEGIGGEAKPKEAVACLEKAAAEGVVEAYKTLGMFYLSGFCVDKDANLALTYFEKAANGGLGSAYEIMGDIYFDGKHVDKDIELAANLYEKAAKSGFDSAARKLEDIINTRTNVYKNALTKEASAPEEAFLLLNHAVSMGHVPAYQRLARAYLLGLGTRRNTTVATALLKRAVSLGDQSAIYPLGVCYLRGIGIKQSYKEARSLLETAQKNGVALAGEHISAMLESKRIKLADRYYSRGIRLLYSQKMGLAMQSFLNADKLGHACATYTIGCFYEFGLGVECNKDRAYELYEEAFKNKFRDPRASYKLTVLKLIKNTIKK